MIIEEEAYLEHFGVKGMHWGVRKEKLNSTKRERTTEQRKVLAKKVAVGTGVLLVVAGAAVVTRILYKNGKKKVSDLPDLKNVKDKIDDILKEPTKILHASRGKQRGFQFFKDGGVPSPLQEYESAFGKDTWSEGIKRYGKNSEKIAASFLDPEGRIDQSGRIIPHQVIIPKTMTEGVNSLDDVVKKIWPLLKDTYRYD